MIKKQARILIVDDENDLLNACEKIFSASGYKPILANSGKLAIQLLKEDEFDLILCDLFMPEIDGIQVLEKGKQFAPHTPFIIFSAYGTIDRAVSAMKLGAFDFIEKPFDFEHLNVIVEKGLSHRKLYLERTNLIKQLEEKYNYPNIVGQSTTIRKVFDMIENVAQTDANILITGESGTGKELIARSIHAKSSRCKNAFVPVNCSAFPENLFESELFGYEKGAFTGATKRKLGLLEFADGGTFFLDEVFELPITLQAKLLRVLQDQQLRHVGGNELVQIDIRLISATNCNLQQALQSGQIREDLYYRLNVVNIHIPPLRERKEDIPLLAEYFLQKQLKSSSKDIVGFNPQVLKQFELYNWPGNIRELENVLEHAISLSRDKEIKLHDLPSALLNIKPTEEKYQSLTNLPLAEAKNRAIEEVEKMYLLKLLKECNGNVTKISEKAKMTRRNLHRLLNRHSLNPSNWRNR